MHSHGFDAIAEVATNRLKDFESQRLANTMLACATVSLYHQSCAAVAEIARKSFEGLDFFRS